MQNNSDSCENQCWNVSIRAKYLAASLAQIPFFFQFTIHILFLEKKENYQIVDVASAVAVSWQLMTISLRAMLKLKKQLEFLLNQEKKCHYEQLGNSIEIVVMFAVYVNLEMVVLNLGFLLLLSPQF